MSIRHVQSSGLVRLLSSGLMATALGMAIALPAAHAGGAKASPSKPAAGTVVDVALGDARFSTLVKALQAAGLVETLQGKGPFTVFAPTNEAFARLPPGALDALLKDKARLTAVLTYHVVPGRFPAAAVAKAGSLRTVQGGDLTVSAGKAVKVEGAQVIATDIAASNGIIHVIDTVVLPR